MSYDPNCIKCRKKAGKSAAGLSKTDLCPMHLKREVVERKTTTSETRLRYELKQLLDRARKAGYVMQVDVGKLPPKRLSISLSALYLKPLDGSDQFVCSCCGNIYEPKTTSKHMPNYVPINWCVSCRSGLVEAGGDDARVLERYVASRKGLRAIIRDSERRLLKRIESWGPAYKARYREEVARRKQQLKEKINEAL